MIKLQIAKIVDHGNAKLGQANGHDFRPKKIVLPSKKIADRGNVKLGDGNGHDLRPARSRA